LKKKKELKLDDDDLALVQEQFGERERPDSGNMDVPEEAPGQASVSIPRREPDDLDDDVNDFIDDADDGIPVPRRQSSEHSMQDAMQLRDAAILFEVTPEEIERMQRGGAVQNDAEYDEDDEDDDYVGDQNKKIQKQKSIQLKRNYEPSVLQAQYISDRDDEIRSKDIPERLQLHIPQDLLDQTDSERQEEAAWISSLLKNTVSNDPEMVKAAVIMVLEFLQTEKMEIPYVKWYKEEDWKNVLTHSNLWEIYDLVGRWGTFVKQRATADKVCEGVIEGLEREDEDSTGSANIVEQVRMYKSLLSSVKSETGLQILQEQVSLLSDANAASSEASDRKKTAQRRSRNADKFKLAKKEGLLAFALTFCLSPLQYGELLQRGDAGDAVRLYEPPCPEFDTAASERGGVVSPVATAAFKEGERCAHACIICVAPLHTCSVPARP
jgi:hypothetical protein